MTADTLDVKCWDGGRRKAVEKSLNVKIIDTAQVIRYFF